MSTVTTPPARDAADGGKYLTFFLGDEEYGVAIRKVREIVGLRAITRVPSAPAFVRGAIHLHGKRVPVVDLRERFGMSPADAAASGDARQVARAEALRCLVVVEASPGGGGERGAASRILMGLVVDRVSDVAAIDAGAIAAPPAFGTAVRVDLLVGIATGGARARLLLDIDRVLAPTDGDELARAAA